MPRIPTLVRALLVLFVLALAACHGGKNKTDKLDLLPVEDLYAQAHQSLESGNWDRAATYYKRLIARFPFGKYNEQAQLELAYAYYKEHKSEEAVSAIDHFIKLYPTHEKIPYAFYLRGLVNFSREGGWLARLINRDESRHDLTYAAKWSSASPRAPTRATRASAWCSSATDSRSPSSMSRTTISGARRTSP